VNGAQVCDWCHKDVQHGSSTSNLASHLRVRHPQVVAGTDLAIPPPCLGANRKPRARKPKAENLQTLFEDAFLKWAVATGQFLIQVLARSSYLDVRRQSTQCRSDCEVLQLHMEQT
jgi:BED zinc finger